MFALVILPGSWCLLDDGASEGRLSTPGRMHDTLAAINGGSQAAALPPGHPRLAPDAVVTV